MHIRQLLLLVLIAPLSIAAEEDSLDRDYASELPRISPTEAANALATFTVHPGFHLELVASEPLLRDPVAVAFDADVRCYVVEMTGYSEQRVETPGTVRLLEDTDGDGVYDKQTTFLDDLPWAVAVACWDGGVFVGSPPDILFAKDTDGDGVADLREVAFTGFNFTNVQGMMNSFQWGLDGRIHGATSSSGGEVTCPSRPDDKPVVLGGRDFSFDPRTRELRPESGGAQHGMSFDDLGNKFVCSNSDHLQWVWYDDADAARNPWFAPPAPRESIAVDGPAAEVFRLSPVEPWREVRTRLRVKGLVPGPIEGGGRAAGYFTSATGITIYRGDAWPAEYHGQAIIGDVGGNLIHRKRIDAGGLDLKGVRADEGREFIASTDIWFRPVQFANAPDGCLYVLDMYREVIEHPDSLPPIIKQHLDLTSGNDRGRIYRIAPEGFTPRPAPRLSGYASADLVPLLAHGNAWHHETAARLLIERQDSAVIPALTELGQAGESPEGRFRALFVLHALNALAPETLAQALQDTSPIVRRQAVRLAAKHAESYPVRKALLAVASDADPWVRLQAAWSLGAVPSGERVPALASILVQDVAQPRVRAAALASSHDAAGRLATALAENQEFLAAPAAAEVLTPLSRIAGSSKIGQEVAAILMTVRKIWEAHQGMAEKMLLALAESSPAAANNAAGMLDALVRDAAATAVDSDASGQRRADAVRVLKSAPAETALPIFKQLLDASVPDPVREAAIDGLGRMPGAATARALLGEWPGLSPARRAQAIELLFRKDDSLMVLLFAIESGTFKLGDLDSTRIHALQANPNPKVATMVERILANRPPSSREAVVAQYQAALGMAGDVARGEGIFVLNCAPCHRMHGQGNDVGPNLATVLQAGPDKILVNVLDPNRELNPQYVNYTLRTTDAQVHTGILVAETATSVTLKRGYGETDVVARADIDTMQGDAVSLMPEGFEATIDLQAMADLLAFLQTGPAQ